MKNKIYSMLYFFLIIFSLYGCAALKPEKLIEKKEFLFYPPQPEEPHIQYLTSFSSSYDIEGGTGGFRKFVLGDNEPSKPIIKPYGVKVRNGKVYICDTVYNGLEILDLNKKKFEYFTPTGAAQLIDPINLDLSDDGRLFVADARRGQVVVFDSSGNYLTAIGAKGEFKPTDVDIWGGRIFVCDLKTQSVRVYKLSDYSFLYSIPKDVQGKKISLFSPLNVDIDSQGNVYITEAGAFRVSEYSNEGLLLKTFGTHGDSPGQFARPKGLAVDKEGLVYAVDAAFENVQIFDPQGNLLLYFPEPQDKASLVLPAGICIDYENTDFFSQFINKDFQAKYLIFVVSQYGDRKVSVFCFGQKRND